MFHDVFDKPYGIRWLYWGDKNGDGDFTEFLDGLAEPSQAQVLSRMEQFADHGKWATKVGFIKMLNLGGKSAKAAGKIGIAVLEVKSHQERVLFVRKEANAIIVGQFTKKDDWSKRDDRKLLGAVKTAERLVKELRVNPPKDERQ